MSWLALLVLLVHFCLLLILCLFGLHRLSMVLRWFKYKNIKPEEPQQFSELPMVTVQVPLYNERFVATRIIDACAAFDYPADKLQIQIVDDSTDDTASLVSDRVNHYKRQGINIEHVQRKHRAGFKAGALRAAMPNASGEFIAIFDADFVPAPELLRDTIDYFCDARIGMLQFRWDHLNRHDSYFTQSQSMMLDAHFVLEQQVRYASNRLFNFNGTAGIWRRETIIDAGNWSADTLTEDLDLSYRAQMRGWKMLYLNNVACAGEIPANMNAFKSQQHRWAKGGIQVMKKIIGRVWRSPYRLGTKVESTFHLANNLAYFIVFIDTLFFVIPSLWIRDQYHIENIFLIDLTLLLFASGGHLIYLFFGQVALGRSKGTAFLYLPLLMLLGIQLAFNNARAGLEALLGQPSEFVRTPKRGEVKKLDSSGTKSVKPFYDVVLPKSAAVELIVALIYIFALVWALDNQKWMILPFLLLIILGFTTTAASSLKSQLTSSKHT